MELNVSPLKLPNAQVDQPCRMVNVSVNLNLFVVKELGTVKLVFQVAKEAVQMVINGMEQHALLYPVPFVRLVM